MAFKNKAPIYGQGLVTFKASINYEGKATKIPSLCIENEEQKLRWNKALMRREAQKIAKEMLEKSCE